MPFRGGRLAVAQRLTRWCSRPLGSRCGSVGGTPLNSIEHMFERQAFDTAAACLTRAAASVGFGPCAAPR